MYCCLGILIVFTGSAHSYVEYPRAKGDLVYRDSGGKIYGRTSDGDFCSLLIPPGFHPGHVGVYDGDGMVIEAVCDGGLLHCSIMKTPLIHSPGKRSFYFDEDGDRLGYPLGAKTHRDLLNNPNANTLREMIIQHANKQDGESYDSNFAKQKGPNSDDWTCVGFAEKVYESAGSNDLIYHDNYGDEDLYAEGLNITPDGYDWQYFDTSCYYQSNVEFSQVIGTIFLGRLFLGHNFIFFPWTQFNQPTLIDSFPVPDLPSPDPSTGSWDSLPQDVEVTCDKADVVAYTVSYTLDGSEPSPPLDPTEYDNFMALNSEHKGIFDIRCNPGQYKRLKVKFRGNNSSGWGPTSETYSYSIDLRVNANPGTPSADPISGTWTSTPQNIDVSCANASRIYCTIRTAIDTIPWENPPPPTKEVHDIFDEGVPYIGPSGTFKIWGEPGHKKFVKVCFRGWKEEGDIYGDTSGIYLYEIDLTGGSDPGDDGTTPDGPDGNVKMLEISDDGTHWHHSYNAHPGQNLETEITISNKGDETIDYFEVFVHRSNDLYFDHNSDYSYGREEETDDLDPGERDKKHRTIEAPSTPGTYYIFAYVNRVDGKEGGTDQNWVNNYSRNDDKEEYAKLVVYPLPPREWSAIKEEDSSTIYIFHNNKKWRTTSGSVLSALGFNSNDFITYPDGTLSQYSDGPNVMSEGLLGQLGSAIYLFEGDKWHYLPDWAYMDCRGGQHPENVFPLTSALFGMYASGEDLTPCVPPPVADFTASSQETTTLDEVQFTDISTNQISSWYWDFGDGDSSDEQHPSHTYSCPGTYLVQLTVTGPGGTDQQFFYITVTYPEPLAGAYALGGTVTVNGVAVQGGSIVAYPPGTDPFVDYRNKVYICDRGQYQIALTPGTYDVQLGYGITKCFGETNTWGSCLGITTNCSINYIAAQNLAIDQDTTLNIPIALYTLTGKVTDPKGIGIPDVQVKAKSSDTTSNTTTTDDGSYILYVLPGTYDLSLIPPQDTRFTPTELNVSVSGNTTRDIVLEEQFLLQGTITIDGKILYNANVYAYSQSSSEFINSVSAKNGNYQIALRPGTYKIRVGGVYYEYGTMYISNICAQDFEIVGDTVLDIPIASCTLTGKVTDTNGVGIPNVVIQSWDMNITNHVIKTTADGSYTLYCLTGNYILLITPPEDAGFVPATVDVNVSGNTVQDIVLEEQQFLLQGTVTANSESPPFPLVVGAYQVDPNLLTQLDSLIMSLYYYQNILFNLSVVDSEGHYQMTLPKGTWKISVSPLLQQRKHMSFNYKVAEDFEIEGDTTLDITVPLYTLSGKVTDINGIGIPGVGIVDYHDRDKQYTTADGSYTFYSTDGIYNLVATPPAVLFPISEIKKLHIFGDTRRNIVLGDKGVLDEAIALLPSGLELHLDVFDIIDRNTMKPYNLAVTLPKDTLEIILNWGGSEMLLKVYRPDGSLYGQWQSGSPSINVNIPNPQVGTWRCEVTAVDIPSDNYPFALVAGISPNKQPIADIGGPYSGQPNSPITFDASSSFDPDGTTELYEWDWDNDGTFDRISTSPTTSHTWPADYNGPVTLRVTDNEGLTDTDSTSVEVINPDQDNDGMLDEWEMQYFKTLSRDGTQDFDNDGLSDLEEYQHKTNPKLKDTDGDGMPDGWEVTYSLDPLVKDAYDDNDGDGFTNYQEYKSGTDPGNRDSMPEIKTNPAIPMLLLMDK